MSKISLGDWLKSINYGKDDLMNENTEKDYVPYIINHSLSSFVDCLFQVNDMNMYHNLSKDIQYKYLKSSIRKNKRFAKWAKPKKDLQCEVIMKHYDCSVAKSKEMQSLLTDAQIGELENRMQVGGVKK